MELGVCTPVREAKGEHFCLRKKFHERTVKTKEHQHKTYFVLGPKSNLW